MDEEREAVNILAFSRFTAEQNLSMRIIQANQILSKFFENFQERMAFVQAAKEDDAEGQQMMKQMQGYINNLTEDGDRQQRQLDMSRSLFSAMHASTEAKGNEPVAEQIAQ